MCESFFFSAVVFALNCRRMSPRQFIANHPFVFVIKNIEMGIVLFAGRLSRV
jgi:serine protease inhibitor